MSTMSTRSGGSLAKLIIFAIRFFAASLLYYVTERGKIFNVHYCKWFINHSICVHKR